MTTLDRLARARLDALWQGLRLVVIDTETTQPDGEPRRVVSVAAVTCRRGRPLGSWSVFVDPQVPIDPRSRRIHGITDDIVAGEPTFADVADELHAYLDGDEDETTVLVAHNVRFDVATLRAELRRVGADDLAELPVLDTMGRLREHLEVDAADNSLGALADALEIPTGISHDALADAHACAHAVVRLLQVAAERGHDDISGLRAAVGETRTTRSIGHARPATPGDVDLLDELPDLPDDHLDSHQQVLSPRVRDAGLRRWSGQLVDCGRHRCPHVEDRVAAAGPRLERLLAPVEDAVRTLAEAGDGPGAATVLPSLCDLLVHLPPKPGRLGMRDAVLDWADALAALLDALDRCEDEDRCPACAAGEPCPLDTWRQAAAPLALGDPEGRARGFLKPTGVRAGHGAYVTWTDAGHDRGLADEVLALVIEHHRRADTVDWAEKAAHYGWKVGSRHPEVAATHAGVLARPGRPSDLQAGLDVIDEALTTRDGSTAPGWRHLTARRAQLAGLQRRARGRPTGEFDEDGNPIVDPPHRPAAPVRTRRARFG